MIYYAGPCPAKPGEVIGSCGPTTAGRMDAYTPMLLDNGLGCMIGKGARSKEVVDAMKRNTVVYLGAIGGAGALIAQSIKKAEVVAYDDLGTEGIRKIEVENILKELRCFGLKGIEVYHPSHSQGDINKFFNLSKKYKLCITGGSDYHGKALGYDNLSIGSYGLNEEYLEKFIKFNKR